MKRRIKPLQKQLRSIHIYRDDLLELERIIKSDLKSSDFKITTEDFEYDSVESIPKDTSSTNQLSIKSYEPYIYIEFERTSAKVYISEDTLQMKGAYVDIISVLNKRESKFFHYIYKIDFLLPGVAIYTIFGFILSGTLELRLVFGVSFLLLSLFAYLGFRHDFSHYSTIEFVNKSTRPNFIVRNRDQLVINTIFLILGALLGVVLTKLFE